MTELADITRIGREHLSTLSPTGRPCETCGGPIHEHEWADLDDDGFAVACSGQSQTP